MVKKARIEITMTPYWKSRLKAEAEVLSMSLNAYVKLILAHRKHLRKPFGEEEVVANGSWN